MERDKTRQRSKSCSDINPPHASMMRQGKAHQRTKSCSDVKPPLRNLQTDSSSQVDAARTVLRDAFNARRSHPAIWDSLDKFSRHQALRSSIRLKYELTQLEQQVLDLNRKLEEQFKLQQTINYDLSRGLGNRSLLGSMLARSDLLFAEDD
ncbi:hypothetical protein MMC20_001347 [Loxospora ochrophaea]|nr:hypothetical protein [Loxospora ochrophaea]